VAHAESEIEKAHGGLSRLAAALEESWSTRKHMQDLVAAARQLRQEQEKC
jgi:hypothetical protein